MPLLSVSANSIDAAGLSLEAELPLAWLHAELDEASVGATAPGHVAVRLSRSGADVVVRGRVRASLTLPCARCTEPAALPVDTELTLLLQPAAAAPKPGASRPKHTREEAKPDGDEPKAKPAKDEEYEFTSAEADVDTFDGETVVLDPFIREAILLEVPNFPLCSEGCPGIGPAAEPALTEGGHNGSGDPRLAPLGALRAKLAAAASPPPAVSPDRPPKKKNKE